MKAVRPRGLAVLTIAIWTIVLSASVVSMNASAAGVAGTWVSSAYGEGYVLDNVPTGPYTWHYDVSMELSQSGSVVSGTATFTLVSVDLNNPSYDPWTGGTGTPFSYTVTGFTDGSVFSIQVYTDDGIVTGDLTYTNDTMYGTTLHSIDAYNNFVGTWDLEKEGMFAVGGINQVVSAIGIGIAIAAIAVALSPGKPSPKGFVPGTAGAPYAQQPTPSRQWTTDTYQQPYTGDQGVPIGGIGLHYPAASSSERPMTEQERQALNGVTRPPKVNAVGLSVMTIVMAVMINFVVEPVALIMPLFFGLISLGTAIQARKVSSSIALSLQKGTVTEAHVSPMYSRGAWDFGAFSMPKDGQLKSVLSEGTPTTVALVPDARRVLSVNNVPLRKPVQLRAAPGFEILLSASPPQRTQTVSRAQASSQEDMPPPPDGWGVKFCPKCGEPVSGDYMFCRKCGLRLKA